VIDGPATLPVRYRARFTQLPWFLLLLGLLNALLMPSDPLYRPTAGDRLDAAKPMLVLFVLVSVVYRWYGVTVREDGITRHAFGSHFHAWTEITDIGERRLLGTRSVRITLSDGQKKTLRFPSHTPLFAPDRDYEAKTSLINDTWRHARGADGRQYDF
jgi:hypothetical protein